MRLNAIHAISEQVAFISRELSILTVVELFKLDYVLAR
jgi:hypothetical protein